MTLRCQILVIFVSTTENGWLNFRGSPNAKSRKNRNRESIPPKRLLGILTVMFILEKSIPAIQKRPLSKILKPQTNNHRLGRFPGEDFRFQFMSNIWIKRETVDGKNNYWLPLNNSNHQTRKSQQKYSTENLKKRRVRFFQIFCLKIYSGIFMFWRLDLFEEH